MQVSKIQKDFYDLVVKTIDSEKANKYKESDRIRKIKLNKLLKAISGKTVLNIGCGTGEFINRTFCENNRVIGLDISIESLKKAKNNNHKPTLCDLENGLPFKNETMDLVIASEVLEHILNTDFLLFEINRVLKDKGILIVTVPNVNFLLSYIMMFFFDFPPYRSARYRSPHVRDFTKKLLEIALENNGFKIIKTCGTAIFIPYIGYFFSKLCDWFPRFGEVLIVYAVRHNKLNQPDTGLELFLK